MRLGTILASAGGVPDLVMGNEVIECSVRKPAMLHTEGGFVNIYMALIGRHGVASVTAHMLGQNEGILEQHILDVFVPLREDRESNRGYAFVKVLGKQAAQDVVIKT
jgi:hypothetical protein